MLPGSYLDRFRESEGEDLRDNCCDHLDEFGYCIIHKPKVKTPYRREGGGVVSPRPGAGMSPEPRLEASLSVPLEFMLAVTERAKPIKFVTISQDYYDELLQAFRTRTKLSVILGIYSESGHAELDLVETNKILAACYRDLSD